MKNIYLIEKTIFEAIKIYGSIGKKTYYYYTKKRSNKKIQSNNKGEKN